MAGIGDAWGEEEELLHPRGPDGRWITAGGIAKSIIGSVLDFLRSFRPRQFQSQNQASQYLQNIASRQGVKRMGHLDHVRLLHDLGPANADLRDGVIDEPSTQKFVDMMERTSTTLPDDVILTRVVGVDAFGFTPETAAGTDADNPGIRGMSGKLVADRGYGLTTVGNLEGSAPQGSVRMVIAAKKGTKVTVPAASAADSTVLLHRDQPLRVTKVTPDGAGGWTMYVTADSTAGAHEVPEPIGGPIGVREPSATREARIKSVTQAGAKARGVPDEQAQAADEAARRAKAAEAQQILAQEKAKRDEAARQLPPTGTPLQTSGPPPRRPAPGEPPPRTEPHVGRVGEAPAAGGVAGTPAAGVPEPTPTPRAVDLKLAIRDAGVESPSAGSRRKQWNEAYLGVTNGKKDPVDAVRELDNDIKILRGGGEPGGAVRGGSEEHRDADIKAFEGLRDVIAEQYGLPKREKAAPAKKAAKKAAPGGMTPEQERAVVDRAKQFRGQEHNDEERRIVAQADQILARQEGAPAPAKAAKKAAPEAPAPVVKKAAPAKKAAPDDLDGMTREELIQLATEQGDTKAKFRNTNTLKAQIRRTRGGTPQAAKKVAKKAAPEAPGDPLDKMTKAELLAIARQEGVQRASSMNKDQLKAGIKRMREIGPVEPGSSVDKENRVREILGTDKKPTVAELRAYAKEKGLTVGPRDRRDRLIDTILAPSPRERADALAGPGVIDRMAESGPAPAPVKKAAKKAAPSVPTVDEARARIIGVPDSERTPVLNEILGPLSPTQRRRLARQIGVHPRSKLDTEENVREAIRERLRGVVAPGVRREAQHSGRDITEAIDQMLRGNEPAPVKKAAKAAPAAPNLEQAGRDQQTQIDSVKGYGKLATEVEELIQNDTGSEALKSRIQATARREGIPEADIQPLLSAVDAGNMDQARVEAQKLTDARGIHPIEHAGDIVPFDRSKHEGIGRGDIADGTMVHVVRPGYQIRAGGEDIRGAKATVEPATPDEARAAERARTLVPEGSVPGPRAEAPVDNAVRRRELRKAMLDANLPPASPGSGRKSQEEIKGDLVAGRITPEEAVRKFESEIAFTDEDLTEVDAHIREGKASGDLSDAELAKLERHRQQLQATRESHVKHAEFLREHFKEEAPVHGLAEAKVQDPVSYEFLKDATPDDMKEAAKQAGLDAPSGSTPDEMFTDLIKQVARRELERRGAKKATKAAKKAVKKAAPEAPPTVPKERERVDAKLLGEGLDLDPEIIDMAQRALDGESVSGTPKNATPGRIADMVDGHARHLSDSTSIRYGSWGGVSEHTPEEEAERVRQLELGRARAQAMRDFATRIRGVRRRPVKKAAPASPEVAKLQDKVDNLEAANIDQVLEQLQGAKSREEGAKALERLTMPELRRLADQAGTPKGRSKDSIRQGLLDRFVAGEEPATQHGAVERAREKLREQVARGELTQEQADRVLGSGDYRPLGLRAQYIADAEAGRGKGSRKAVPAAPARQSLARRAEAAGVPHPSQTFSDVDGAVSQASRRLDAGEDPTVVARFLRERAAQVAKADLHEEGRRFPVEYDTDSLKSIRKSSADYLRRVATHVQQEKKAQAPAKKVAPGASGSREPVSLPDILRRLNDHDNLLSREEAAGLVEPLSRAQLQGMAKDLGIPRHTALSKVELRREIVDATVGRRLDSIATRGFTGRRPGEGRSLAPGESPIEALRAEKAAKKAAPAKKAVPGAPSASRTGTSTVTGERSRTPEGRNHWGTPGGEINFHRDGVIGNGIKDMGEDRLMDVDGEPLSNVLGKLVTRMNRGEISMDQLISELKQLAQRLPEGSKARQIVERMGPELDAPKVKIDIPEGTPDVLANLARALADNPLARGAVDRPGFHRGAENSELAKVMKMIEDFHAGRLSGLRMSGELQKIRGGVPHEANEGNAPILAALAEAFQQIQEILRDKDRRHLLERRTPGATPAKKAARLTAIPGERTGAPKKGTRPKLTVIRNDEGKFSFALTHEEEPAYV